MAEMSTLNPLILWKTEIFFSASNLNSSMELILTVLKANKFFFREDKVFRECPKIQGKFS